MDGGQAYTLDALVSLAILMLALLVVIDLASIALVTTPASTPLRGRWKSYSEVRDSRSDIHW